MTTNEKIQLGISIFAALVSVIAICVSIYSNFISGKAFKLSLDGFNAERRIALKTERDNDHIVFKPLEEIQQIHDVTIYFPTELEVGVINITPPELFIYDTSINPSIKKYFEKKIPPKKDYAQVVLNHPIPALILLHGYSKGYASMSVGIYDFIYEVNRLDDEAKIRLKSAVLNNFHPDADNPQETIDALFEQFKK